MSSRVDEHLRAALGGAYAIERELGGGGMARVFLAEETALGRRVAIKVLAPELSGVVDAERFRHEVRVAARLQHPHIVPLLAAGEAGGMLYYTMPFIEGDSLRARAAHAARFPLVELVCVMRDVARALACAHRHGVVHRDIKPENVLVDAGGDAIVADFGIAKALSASASGRRTGAGLVLGTPAYISPEQAACDPAADHRGDLYSLGVVGYELLAGVHPYAGRSPRGLLAAHILEPPAPVTRHRPDAPPPLTALVMHLLAKDPADRPQSAEAVVRELDALTALSARSRSGVWAESGRRWHRVVAAATGAAATLTRPPAADPPRYPPASPEPSDCHRSPGRRMQHIRESLVAHVAHWSASEAP
jgi:serine/threonine-protein kinase